jgi:hypothetical protein
MKFHLKIQREKRNSKLFQSDNLGKKDKYVISRTFLQLRNVHCFKSKQKALESKAIFLIFLKKFNNGRSIKMIG